MITSKQRAYLRSLTNKIEPIVYIGKAGITENLVEQVSDALEAREIVKGSVQENCPLTAQSFVKPSERNLCRPLDENSPCIAPIMKNRKFSCRADWRLSVFLRRRWFCGPYNRP